MTNRFSCDKSTHTITLWDTRGEEGHDRLRPLAYPQTNVVPLCFSVASMESFENITTNWLPEVAHVCPGAPWILIGTNADARLGGKFNGNSNLVSISEIRELARNTWWSARETMYVECDARKRGGLEALLSEVWFPQNRQL